MQTWGWCVRALDAPLFVSSLLPLCHELWHQDQGPSLLSLWWQSVWIWVNTLWPITCQNLVQQQSLTNRWVGLVSRKHLLEHRIKKKNRDWLICLFRADTTTDHVLSTSLINGIWIHLHLRFYFQWLVLHHSVFSLLGQILHFHSWSYQCWLLADNWMILSKKKYSVNHQCSSKMC